MKTPPKNSLRFTPYAWGKLCFLRDWGRTEVSFLGVSTVGDMMLIRDVLMISQECTSVTTEMDGEDMAEFMEQSLANGVPPSQCCRIWIHTHPGNSASPSMTDEETFRDIFSSYKWSVMAILARGGDTYARLQFSEKIALSEDIAAAIQPNNSVMLAMGVDWLEEFEASKQEAWVEEYEDAVKDVTNPNVHYSQYDSWRGGKSLDLYHESDDFNLDRQFQEVEDSWAEEARLRAGDSTQDDRLFCIQCNKTWYPPFKNRVEADVCPDCGSDEVDYYADMIDEAIEEQVEAINVECRECGEKFISPFPWDSDKRDSCPKCHSDKVIYYTPMVTANPPYIPDHLALEAQNVQRLFPAE